MVKMVEFSYAGAVLELKLLFGLCFLYGCCNYWGKREREKKCCPNLFDSRLLLC